MEKQEQNQRACRPPPETDLLLQWGNRKRLRCVRMRDSSYVGKIRRKIASRFVNFPEKISPSRQPTTRLTRNSETATVRPENRKSASPEKEEKWSVDGIVWPKLNISLSTKEKEEDFMAMKGCKLPHRPKKRPKIIQRTLLLVSPGAWLTDMCQERYEVREKKTSKKRARGLKALGSMESDSE